MAISKIGTFALANNSVVGNKFANNSITSAKLANTAVTAGDYGSAGNIPSITINEKGQVTRVSNVQVEVAEAGFNPFLLAGM
tara:strand:- start:690 stop:935 length:246 start_codon:yes stop_codon:yes gene_type:complete